MPRPRRLPVGLGEFDIPYDRSEEMSGAGFEIPQPGGNMKKLSLEFADAQDAAAATQQPQIPQGAGIPPAGMQGGIPPAGMQPPPDMGGMQQSQGGGLFESMMNGGMQQPGMDSSMFSDQQLMEMVQDDPADLQSADMDAAMMDPNTPPQVQQQLQHMMMDAARRRMTG